MSTVEILGYAASATVLATFCMSTMIPLRLLALCSNVLFCGYGYFDHLLPVLILHAILFPINAIRLVQFYRLVRQVQDAHKGEFPIEGILPYMTPRKFSAGDTILRKGERADKMFYLAKGELEIVEVSHVIPPGTVFGEIGAFGRDQVRTATIVARTSARVYELTAFQAKQIFLQDRLFGFSMMQMIIDRLLENNKRLQDRSVT